MLGFASLREAVGPGTVGDCLEDEHPNPENGDALQRTTGGLLVWRKADNVTAFTDGGRTWVLGPFGLQQRPAAASFAWEACPGGGRELLGPGGCPGAWRRDDVQVVFLAGYGSTSDFAADLFAPLAEELARRGWGRGQLRVFGYAGGRGVGGAWAPNPYDCAATQVGLGAIGRQLDATLATLRTSPASRFVLVGHSLGGVAALQRVSRGGAGDPVIGVLTVDAPLRGVSPGKLLALRELSAGCAPIDDQTLRDLGAGYARRDALAGEWAALVRTAAARGTRVTTVGNELDCLFAPGLPECGWFGADDRGGQYVEGAALRLRLPGAFFESHLAPLRAPEGIRTIADLVEAAGQPR